MKLMYYSPRQVPEETIIFILSCAIIGMKMNVGFAEPMVMKVMMDKAYCCVCPFTYVTCFVNEIVYLPRDRPFSAIDHVINFPIATRLWWASEVHFA